MKIGVVHVTTEAASGPYTALITANLERAKADGTEIVHRYVAAPSARHRHGDRLPDAAQQGRRHRGDGRRSSATAPTR